MSKKKLYNSIPRNGLVGEWLLNGNANDTNDGTKNNGTATNVTYANTTIGYQKQYGETTGNGYIDVGDFYSGSGSYTIGGWFNSDVTATSGDYNLIYRYSNSLGYDTTRAYFGGYGNNTIIWKRCSGTQSDVNNTLTISETFVAGKWYHMSFELDDVAKTAKFYLNGRLHTSGSFTGALSKSTTATQKCSFLNRYYNANEGWDGKAQGLRVYNRTLSQNEIQNLYLEGLRTLGGGADNILASAVAYYVFE